MKKRYIFLFAFLAVMFAGCISSSTQGGVVGADRRQFFLVSEAEMDKGAALAYTKTLKQASANRTLNTNPIETKRVKKIAHRLIKQVGVFREDALRWDWQVNVINDKTINAWCMPGGRIVVYSGIINTLKLTDAELAAIMGHEMAHALREHSREQASSDQVKNIGIFAVSEIAGLGNMGQQLANMAAYYTISLPFSRSHETEADTIGTELMARAGYNPNAAIELWQKMNKISGKQPIQFMSTHPSNETRIKDLKVVVEKVMPLYQNSKKS